MVLQLGYGGGEMFGHILAGDMDQRRAGVEQKLGGKEILPAEFLRAWSAIEPNLPGNAK